ncbi:MAG TPA: DUF4377 domain-containing protein [Bacteroidales bacterium]|nr:DUF4377 domain-containing protein [Bacteroidales bacterium]
MKRIVLLISFITLAMVIIGCNREEDPNWSERAEIIVSHKTTDYWPGEYPPELPPMVGISIRKINETAWTKLPIDGISGFTYESGYEYHLKVKITHLADPPMDGPNRTYESLKIISKTQKLIE